MDRADGSEAADRDGPPGRSGDRGDAVVTGGGAGVVASGGRRRDDRPVLPEQSRDDTDRGWGDRPDSNDDRLLAERPPHW